MSDFEQVQCPFALCRQYVEVLPTKPNPMVEQHDMPDVGIGIVRPCPASLMRYPPRASEIRALVEQAESLGPRTRMAYEQGVQHRIKELGKKYTPAESQSLRQPGRLGREPEPKSPDWYLGGRESEELTPVPTPKNTENPPGYALGRDPKMASITELANLVNAAGGAGAEAIAALNTAKESLQRAQAACTQLLDQSSSISIESMRGLFGNAVTSCDEGITIINQAADIGQNYVANLYS